MSSETLYMCDSCKGRVNFEKIKYSRDGKRLVCVDCLSKLSKERDSIKPKIQIIRREGIHKEEQGKIKFICKDCRYKFFFNIKKGKNIKCPYCGKSNLMRYEATAEKLVKEASGRDYS